MVAIPKYCNIIGPNPTRKTPYSAKINKPHPTHDFYLIHTVESQSSPNTHSKNCSSVIFANSVLLSTRISKIKYNRK